MDQSNRELREATRFGCRRRQLTPSVFLSFAVLCLARVAAVRQILRVMPEPDRLQLLHGPYLPPRVRRGDRLFCEIRGTVVVGGYTDAPIPWPRLKKGGANCLILCGDLVRAV